MTDILNDFTKLYLRCLEENCYSGLIRNGVNYEQYFRTAKNISSIYELFHDELKLTLEDIVGFYLINGHENLGSEDLNLVMSILQTNDINQASVFIKNAKHKATMLKQGTISFASKLKDQIAQINALNPVTYTNSEKNELQKYKMVNLDDTDVKAGDALIIFNKITCSTRYPCVVYCNSNGEKIVRCGNGMSVKFPIDTVEKLQVPDNSITILNEIGEPITFNFETGTCQISINTSKLADDTLRKISNFLPMLKFIEEENSKKIVGKISFNVDIVLDYFMLYHFFITNPIASTLFFVDETNRAWCSKNNFYLFFRDFSYEMIKSTEIKTSENYFRILIPTERLDNTTGFTISYSAKSNEMLPSFLYKFSRLLSLLTNNSSSTSVGMDKLPIVPVKFKLYTKCINVLSEKAGKFFDHESKSRDETAIVASGDYYSRVCQSNDQPIIITPDSVNEWIEYGREPMSFPPPEWGFKETLLFVCPKEIKPIVNLKVNKQDTTGRIKALPCCAKNKKKKKIEEVTNRNLNRRGISELINKISTVGTLNDALSSFLSISYSDDASYVFSKIGTFAEDDNFMKLNSFIIAILLATGRSPDQNNPLTWSSDKEIKDNIQLVKNSMARLPTDVYRQELYDMSDSQIIESILDPETFIDPYLYYRGLEILFNVQIFTFTSDIGRKNPISRDEDILPIATLEVPRCKYTHIRYDNGNDIICLYKNYGSQDKRNKIPACELIASSLGNSKVYNKKVNNSNIKFFRSLFNLLDRVCHPYEWERDDRVPIYNTCLDDPYSTINWSQYNFHGLGPILGQEIDIYGKTSGLIFKDWTLLIPPTQPMFIYNNEKRNIDTKYGVISTFSGGIKERPPLKPFSVAHLTFETSGEDEDGVWIPFNGKNKGLKVLCQKRITVEDRKYNIDENISLINKTIIFMTIINWLWRSEGNSSENKLVDFETWFNSKVSIEDDIIFSELPSPRRNCHNMMLPTFETYEQRMEFVSSIWPFMFYRKKIHVNEKLYRVVMNFFKVEEIYSRDLPEDSPYRKPSQFITGLIPTDEDFQRNGDIILTKPEHISDWIAKNNSSVFKYKSLHNTNVIISTIPQSFSKLLEPYLFKDQDGKIYIVQNSSKKGRPVEEPALMIAQFWKTHERNPGHSYMRNDDKHFYGTVRYVEYRIDHDEIPKIFIDKSQDDTNCLQILRYDDGETFAAMLPIL